MSPDPSVVATTVVLIPFLLVCFYRIALSQSWVGPAGTELIAIALFGSFGALFSVLTRATKVDLDPSAGQRLYTLEGISRIVVGILAAGVVALAAKSGLAFSILASEEHRAGFFLIGFVAGASERLAPTFIKKVESGESKEEK